MCICGMWVCAHVHDISLKILSVTVLLEIRAFVLVYRRVAHIVLCS